MIGNNSSCLERTRDLEDAIDNFQGAITHYLVELARRPLTEVESEQLPVLLHTVNDLERVGGHAENIVELAENHLDHAKHVLKIEKRLNGFFGDETGIGPKACWRRSWGIIRGSFLRSDNEP